MNRDALEPLALADDFKPFKIITSAGVSYDITDPGGLALGKSDLFYFFPRSDRSIRIPYTHIATIDEAGVTRRK